MYGIEIRDADGNITLDNERLTHRLWHWGVYPESTAVTYPTPLSHEPTIVVMGIGSRGALAEHVIQDGLYVGFEIGTAYKETAQENLIVVFARE